MSTVVAILFGGQSSEHPVSLMSTASVLNNLNEKYQKYLVGITKDGRWYHFTGEVSELDDDKWMENPNNEEVILSPNRNHHGFYNLKTGNIDKVDVVFPVLHGRFGEDGTVQGICDIAGIKCVSCSLTSCALAMDKEITHILCENAGIKMAKYMVGHIEKDKDYPRMFKEAEEKLGLPMYVKPTKEGSSFGAHKIHNYEEFVKYSDDAYSYDNKILYEEFIDGNEVGCGVLNKTETGEVYEVIVETEMYGYAEKYDGYKTNIYYPAKNLNKEQRDEVNRLGVKIAEILQCDVMARVDFFNSSKGIIFNEANLIPGFTSHSLYPAMFKAKGMSYSELLDNLIESTMGE